MYRGVSAAFDQDGKKRSNSAQKRMLQKRKRPSLGSSVTLDFTSPVAAAAAGGEAATAAGATPDERAPAERVPAEITTVR